MELKSGTKFSNSSRPRPGTLPDMLDTDLDLEADLGIDTVKQAEFISEVREAFNIPRIDGLKIADFPTIKHIIGFMEQEKRPEMHCLSLLNNHRTWSLKKCRGLKKKCGSLKQGSWPCRLLNESPRPEADEVLVPGGNSRAG